MPVPEQNLSGPVAKRGIVLIPDTGGLGIEGDPRRIDFGRATEGVIPTLNRELGPGREVGLAGCPQGITRQVAWGGLVLSFAGQRFIGWRTDQARAGQTCG